MVDVLSSKTGAERLAIAAGMFRSARRKISSPLEVDRDRVIIWADRFGVRDIWDSILGQIE